MCTAPLFHPQHTAAHTRTHTYIPQAESAEFRHSEFGVCVGDRGVCVCMIRQAFKHKRTRLHRALSRAASVGLTTNCDWLVTAIRTAATGPAQLTPAAWSAAEEALMARTTGSARPSYDSTRADS